MVRSLFKTGKPNPRIASAISITSPNQFRQSIKRLKDGRYSLQERRSLIFAQNRAKLQLKRRNLSPMEKKQMRSISKIKIPKY